MSVTPKYIWQKLDSERTQATSAFIFKEQAAAVKRDVHRFAEHLMAVIEAKRKEISNKVNKQVTSKRMSRTSANFSSVI